MIKAVLFDLDNTLIDFMGLKKIASESAASAMIDAGLEADKERLSRELYDFYLEHGIESDDAFQKFLEEKYSNTETRILAAAVNAYLKTKQAFLEPYPGVIETLLELSKRGIKLAVVTDAPRFKAWQRLNAIKIDKFFNTVVTYDDTGKQKPAKEPFQKALEQLNVNPGECLFVGDWPERDVDGAKAIGMKTCHAKYGQVIGRETTESDYSLNRITEILDII